MNGGNPGSSSIAWQDVQIGDIVNMRTAIMRRDVLNRYAVIGKPDAPGYEGLIIAKPEGGPDMHIRGNMITYIEIIGHVGEVQGAGNPNTAVGTCYEDAWRFLIKEEEGFLVHGTVQFHEGVGEKHAWVELTTGWVWEPQTKSYFTLKDFEIASPVEEHRYTVEQAAIMVTRSGNMGPWSDEERAEWLK